MQRLQALLKQNYSSPRWIIIVGIGIAIVGIFDASYLTIEHLRGVPVQCGILQGCDIVTNSAYSEFLGIPTAAMGVLYYIFAAGILIAMADMKRVLFAYAFSALSVIGFLFSAWFVYLQLFVINAICIYCMLSATSSTLLFLLGMYILYLLKKEEKTA